MEIHIQLLHRRVGRILEINRYHAAHGGGHLIHQTTGLSEEHILRVLADLGQLHRRAAPLPEKLIEHGPHQHLIGSGRTQTAALGDGGGHVHIQSPLPQITAHGAHAGRYAPDQRRRGIDLFLLRVKIAEIHLDHGISLRQHPDDPALRRRHGRQNIQINRGGQYAALLMIGVVSSDLRTAGCAEQRLRRTVKDLIKLFHDLHAAEMGLFCPLRTIKPSECFMKCSLLHIGLQPCICHTSRLLVFFVHPTLCGLLFYVRRSYETA